MTTSKELRSSSITQPLDKPSLCHVMLMNDEFTPIDFVVEMLQNFLGYSYNDAMQTALETHETGASLCGTYSREIAETKVSEIVQAARQKQYPLVCEVKRVDDIQNT